MFLQQKKLVLSGVLLLLLVLLTACSFAGSNGNSGTSSNQGQGSTSATSAVATSTPQLVTPKASKGSAGKGPVIVSSPTPVPGGKPGSQQIVLGDRTLIINSVSKQNGVSANFSLINVNLAVQNTGSKAIMNQSSFFMLIGSEGDTFNYQVNSPDNFYGTIAAHTTHSGTIVFQVPAAAASSLRLLYRPEIATETAIIELKIA